MVTVDRPGWKRFGAFGGISFHSQSALRQVATILREPPCPDGTQARYRAVGGAFVRVLYLDEDVFPLLPQNFVVPHGEDGCVLGAAELQQFATDAVRPLGRKRCVRRHLSDEKRSVHMFMKKGVSSHVIRTPKCGILHLSPPAGSCQRG